MFLFSVVISRGGLGSERRKRTFLLINTSKVYSKSVYFLTDFRDSFVVSALDNQMNGFQTQLKSQKITW